MSEYLTLAQSAAERIPQVLVQRGLDPAISRCLLVQTRAGAAWLFVVLDTHKTPRLEAYTSSETVHQISTAIGGHPVILSNTTGLRYAVLLSPPPRLPKTIEFSGWRAGLVQIGQTVNGDQVITRWPDLGHVLVAGATGSGKSTFLRLLLGQAISEGHSLALADPDGRSFPQLAGHPSLIAPLGQTLEGCKQVLDAVQGEIIRRRRLYEDADGYPDGLDAYNAKVAEKLPRLVVMVDEFNGLVLATGGPRASLAQTATQIAWRGRKFGVTLVLAGQDFSKEIVGPVRDQMTSRVCFRVANAGVSRLVLNHSGAERIVTPGRAWTSWGLVQTYRGELAVTPQGDGLTKFERELAARLIEQYQGRMSRAALVELGIPEREARRLRRDWDERGLAEARPDQDNALCVVSSRFSVPTGWGAPTAPTVPTDNSA